MLYVKIIWRAFVTYFFKYKHTQIFVFTDLFSKNVLGSHPTSGLGICREVVLPKQFQNTILPNYDRGLLKKKSNIALTVEH